MGNCRKITLACLLAFGGAASAQAEIWCDPSQVHISGAFGQAGFRVDVADTDETRARGLMHVEHMPRFEGMLFIYDSPRPAYFWMRNTLIPLDMLFANERGEITSVYENAIPLDETVISGGESVKFVLEINGGMAAILGVRAGDRLHHPTIEDSQIKSCESQ